MSSDHSDQEMEEDVEGDEEEVEPESAGEEEEVASDLEDEGGEDDEAANSEEEVNDEDEAASISSDHSQAPQSSPRRDPDEDEPPVKMQKWCVCSRLASTGDWNNDLLNLYLEEKLHDCTFKVGTNEIGLKLFRCHRLILAQSSEVFRAMLYGNFAEAKKDPESEIVMETVSPAAFDATMKFVYGKVEEFNNLEHTLEVLKFAHKYDIVKLQQVAQVACWKFNIKSIDFLKMFLVFEKLQLKKSATMALKFIKSHCGRIILSKHWELVDEDIVKVILEQPELNIHSELDLINALIVWGKNNNVEAEGTTLREKINGLLPLVRFLSLYPGVLARIGEELMLTDLEKSSILSSKILKRADLMPADFSRCEESRACFQQSKTLTFTDYQATEAVSKDVAPLYFSVTDDTYLLAVEIYSLNHFNRQKLVDISVRVMHEDTLCGKGNSYGSNVDGKICLKWPTFLQKGMDYTIFVDYSGKNHQNQTCAKIRVFEESHSNDIVSVNLPHGELEFKDVTSLLFGMPK